MPSWIIILVIAIIVVVGFAILSIGMGWQIIAEFLLITIPITDQKRGLKRILLVTAAAVLILGAFIALIAWRVSTL